MIVPPNWLKSTVTLLMVSPLLSPLAVLSQVAVTVSPILNRSTPDPPEIPMLPSVTVGAILSTVALVVSAVVLVLPALSEAVTLTFLLMASMAPAVSVVLAVQVPALLVAATASPPPNWLKSMVAPLMVSLLLSPPAVLFQVAVTVSPILYAPPVPDPPEMLILASVTAGATLSTVALVVSNVEVKLPALSVALKETFLLPPSMAPAVSV